MKSLSRAAMLALVTIGQFAATSARAQAADSLTRVKSNGSIVVASTTPADTTPHKKGMFGKLKSVAQNKTVQNITKAAVCTAVPGGQYMMGAAQAAKAKTSVAAGMAGSQSCIPGMGGAAGMGALGGKGALASVAAGTASSVGGGGLGAMIAGGRGMPGATSATTAGTGEMQTEASGEQMKLSGPVPDEIKKGKLVIKKIDWVRSTAAVSPSTTQGLTDLMMSAGQAIKGTGASYRVDVYMDKKYPDAESPALGAQRAAMVMSLLQAGGQLGETTVVQGKVGKDKEQRVEIVKVK